MKKRTMLAAMAVVVPATVTLSMGTAFATHYDDPVHCNGGTATCVDAWTQFATGTVGVTVDALGSSSKRYEWILVSGTNGATQCYGYITQSAPPASFSCTGVVPGQHAVRMLLPDTSGSIDVQHN